MTPAELAAALRRGDAIPPEAISAEMRAVIAGLLEPSKRGWPRKPFEKELNEKLALIERVERLSASLGSRQRAFNELASGRRNAATVERHYRCAKRLEKLLKQLEDALDEMTRA